MLRCCGDFLILHWSRCWRTWGLGLHKESVVVEEIKEVELRSLRTQFIYDGNYNRSVEFDEK